MKKRGASTAVVIGTLIVGLLIGAGAMYALAPSIGLSSSGTVTVTGAGGGTTTKFVTTTVSPSSSSLCNGGTVTLGLLNDLSGGLSAQGQGDLAAENLAISDVNSYLQSAGCSLTFNVNSQDYKLDTPTALSELQAFHAAGIQVVIGPLSSGATQGILTYANSNHIVLISPSSTAPSLAIANDYLFRTVPNDGLQGKADARELLTAGAKAVIVVNRDDTYGDGLANATMAWLKYDNPNVVLSTEIKYDPATTDFTSTIASINSAYTTLSNQVGAANVAIYAISFQELGSLLGQAQTQAPAILNTAIPWFGSDGEAQNSLLSNSTVGALTSQVGVYSTLFGLEQNNSKAIDFYNRIQGTAAGAAILGGGVFYTFEGYDDVWLAALSIISAGANSGQAVQSILPQVAANFYGLTGPETLQASGDRGPFPGAGYQIWKVVPSGSTYGWVLAGNYDLVTDAVTWTTGNAP